MKKKNQNMNQTVKTMIMGASQIIPKTAITLPL